MKKTNKQKQFLIDSDSSYAERSKTDESVTESSDSDSLSQENSPSSDSDDNLGEDNKFYWSRYNRQNKLGIIHYEFKQMSGVDQKVKQISNSIDSFSLFFDKQLYNSLCEETHNYYQAKKSSHKPHSKHKQWQKPSIAEIKLFIRIFIKMGLVLNDKPTVRMYQSKDELFSSKLIKQLINYEKFQSILSCLSVFKIQKGQNQALSKLQTVISYLNDKFQARYYPEQNLSVIQMIIKFTSRSTFKIYMPLKPIKYVFKAYVLSESRTGIVLNGNLWICKKQSLIDIMRNLVSKYINKGFILSFYRFYSSITVLQCSTQEGFRCYSTAIKNRLKINENIQKQIDKLKPYESLFYVSDCKNMMLTFWKDSKVVCLLSSCGGNDIGQIIRKNKQYESQQVDCPQKNSLLKKCQRC